MAAEKTPPFSHEVPEEFVTFARRVPNPVICDIGSRDALDAIYLYRALASPECHVFEPNPYAIRICKENIAKHGADCTILFNEVALSDREGTIEFYPVDADRSERRDIGLSSIFPVNPRYMKGRGKVLQDKITVRTTTLDAYFAGRERKPDLLWVDVEGAELLVFKGGAQTLSHVSIIHVEIGFRAMHLGKPLFWDVDSYLKSLGFSFHKFIGISRFKQFLAVNRLLPNLPWRWNAVYYR